MNFKIIYDPIAGKAIPDGVSEAAALEFLSGKIEECTVSSAIFIDAIRVQVKRGIVDHKNVTFMYYDEIINIDSSGRLSYWPHGFCDKTENYLTELLGW